MKKNYKLIVLLFLGVIILLMGYQLINKKEILPEKYCKKDDDCVPSQCCHATKVINKKYASPCTGAMCTLSCETILDCGVSKPVCKNNQCIIKKVGVYPK